MRRLLPLLFLSLGLGPVGYGQELPSALVASGTPRPAHVSLETVYQRFSDDDTSISEVSVPLSLYLPLGKSLSVSLRSNYATVSGDDLATTSGIGDVQVTTSYFQPLGAASLVASLGLNATTGASALSFEEFRTATLASQTVYDLRVPTFGQGIRIAPALTLAFPAGDRAALGVGLAYHYRGPYEPLRDVGDQYDPGEEILLTAGADVQLGEASAASVDLSVGLNGQDTWRGLTYEPGTSFAATVQYLLGLGFHQVRAVARYHARGEGAVPEAAVPAGAVVPTQLQFFVDGRYEVNPEVRVGALARVRTYGESVLFPERQTLFDLGLAPEWSASDRVAVVGRFVYTLGGFSGLTVGGGVRAAF